MDSGSEKPELLFITPVPPEVTGSGTGMRAAAHIEALSRLYRITLCIVDPNDPNVAALISPAIRALCAEVATAHAPAPILARLQRAPNRASAELLKLLHPMPFSPLRLRAAVVELAGKLAGRTFDVVFCFRLHTASFLPEMRRNRIAGRLRILDLDDYESVTHFRHSWTLRHHLGKFVLACNLVDGVKLRCYERIVLPRFDVVTICSELDRRALSRRFPRGRVEVIPNVVRAPARLPPRVGGRPFTLLFLGTMSFPPNADGAEFLCRDILPELRRLAAGRPFRILLAGRNAARAVGHLAVHPEIEVMGDVADVGDCYAQADLAIVPLRSGGGTRIKIIEAFAYGVPVVSTPIGAEGLEVADGEHVRLAADATGFAARCMELMEDQAGRARLVDSGAKLWHSHYTVQAVQQKMLAVLGASRHTATASA